MMMDYMKQKLLDGPTVLRNSNWTGSLACLCVRFALELSMDKTACDVTFAQVERHMRLCVATTAELEDMITLSGSEPLLAEAAFQLMNDTQTNAVHHLAQHLDMNCIHRGRHGELAAALLIMQAFDAARVVAGRRWVSVVDFMEALLPTSEYDTLLQSGPTFRRTEDDNKLTFEAIFKDCGMWFNPIIKIEAKEMISIDHLWKFVTRGAMILCATNQELEGIDIILPVCYTTQNLGPDSVTAIIIHVTNGKDFNTELNESLYYAMDPAVTSTIFSMLPDSDLTTENASALVEPKKKKRKTSPISNNVTPKPVIRMVFALASPEPAIVFRGRASAEHHLDEFTAFDIWLAGLSDQTFKQVQDADLEPYEKLLEHSPLPRDTFELQDDRHLGDKARYLRRARKQRMAPLTAPGADHYA